MEPQAELNIVIIILVTLGKTFKGGVCVFID